MYQLIELTLHREKLKLFSFLGDYPTQCYHKGNYYKFVYFEPLNTYLTPFTYKGVIVNITTNSKQNGWELVRDLPISVAGMELIDLLESLEMNRLRQTRLNIGLSLEGWLFHVIAYGLNSERDTAFFVRLMYLHGYDFEQTTDLFSAIVRRANLAPCFLAVASKLYQGDKIG